MKFVEILSSKEGRKITFKFNTEGEEEAFLIGITSLMVGDVPSLQNLENAGPVLESMGFKLPFNLQGFNEAITLLSDTHTIDLFATVDSGEVFIRREESRPEDLGEFNLYTGPIRAALP